MASKSEKHAKLDRMRSKHTKFLVLEILFGFGTIGWLFAGFYVTVSFGAWFVALIVLAVLACIFEYKRKRLARKIDTAEGVLAAKES